MSTFKLDIQLFGAGGGNGTAGGGNWTDGVSKSAVEATYNSFHQKIEAAKEAIMKYDSVDSSLQAGWSGVDCEQYLEKFHIHAQNVCNQIDEYDVAVKAAVDSIVAQWDEFQAGLIS